MGHLVLEHARPQYVFTTVVLSLAYAMRAWPASGHAPILDSGRGLLGRVDQWICYGGLPEPGATCRPGIEYALHRHSCAFSANQVLAGFSTVLMSLAILLWSAEDDAVTASRSRLRGIYGCRPARCALWCTQRGSSLNAKAHGCSVRPCHSVLLAGQLACRLERSLTATTRQCDAVALQGTRA